jgi:pantetheine-phosphate adenylyltransferase
MRKAIYAGSFDPFTLGHLEILKKAVNLFDHVDLLVASNPNKKHILKSSVREKLIEESIKDLNADSVTISCLDSSETVAYKAQELDVKYLVRGMRGHTDIDGEMVGARMNKEINEELETILFVPDVNLENLSSSLVRSMIGLRGWVEMLETRVPEPVLNQLKENHFEDLIASKDEFWFTRKRLNRPYHNIIHSYDVYHNSFYDMSGADGRNVAYAALYHDVCDTEEKSAEYFNKMTTARSVDCKHERVVELILATDHSKELTEDQLKDDNLCLFVAADLMVLTRPWEKYLKYAGQIRAENNRFSIEEFAKGRLEFLEKTEDKFIFPRNDAVDVSLEQKARDNILKEIQCYKTNKIPSIISTGGLEP